MDLLRIMLSIDLVESEHQCTQWTVALNSEVLTLNGQHSKFDKFKLCSAACVPARLPRAYGIERREFMTLTFTLTVQVNVL